MDAQNREKLSIGTWIGICGVALTLVGIMAGLMVGQLAILHADITSLGGRIDTVATRVDGQRGEIQSQVSSFHAELRQIHGRVAVLETS